MKSHSIQFKFLITVISAILAIAVFIGGFSSYEMDRYIQQHTREFVDVSCASDAAQVNAVFGNVESSVKMMESYVLSLFQVADDIQNQDIQAIILQLSGEMFVNVAANTDGAVAYYLRFAPEISDGKTGIFYSKMNGSDEYICMEPSDIILYDKNDKERVGWFWIPYEAGNPIWLDPYYNQNNGILMISFVVPLYYEGQFIGVVGMDLDYAALAERVRQIKILDHGFARLELNGNVLQTGFGPSTDEQTDISTEKYLIASEELANGMTLVLLASKNDIQKIRYAMESKIFISVIVLALAFVFIVIWVVKRIVKPLRDLTDASIKIANGDYNVEIKHSNTSDIRQLSSAFETMLVNLREHKKLQHMLTYRDALTGAKVEINLTVDPSNSQLAALGFGE